MNDAAAGEAKLHFLDYWRVIRVRAGIITLAFLLVVLTAAVYTYFAPRLYESRVKIQVQPDAAKALRVFERDMQQGVDPRFASTQFQIIQSKEILYPVIDKLDLQKTWSPEGRTPMPKEQTYYTLLKKMNVREVRNTDLLELRVLERDPELAATIANTIADTYREKRISEQRTLLSGSLTQLTEEIAKQEKKVQDAFVEKERIRKALNIVDLSPDTMETQGQAVDAILPVVEKEVSDARLEAAALKTKLSQIERLIGDQLMRALTTLKMDDPIVLKNLPLYQEAVAQEAKLMQSGLGPNHPIVKSIRAQKDVYFTQLNEQVDSIRRSVATNLKIAESTVTSLEEKLQELRTEQQALKTGSQEYIEAKAKYIEAKKVLDAAQLRASTETIEGTMPHHPITIWERAEPALFPTKPNVKLNMALAVFVGLIVGIGLAFFVEYLDTSVKTMEEVEKFLGVPVLAVIHSNVGLLWKDNRENVDTEAYRILRANIEFNRKNANAMTFVSGGPGEGKSTTVCNVAYICALGGYNVLIVDADMRRPSQDGLFEADNSYGLSTYLTTDAQLEELIVPTPVANLDLLPSGPPPSDPSGLLNSQRMFEMIAEVKGRYDIVFFDSPPILGVSDASVLASEVDLTIIVVQHRRFPRSMLMRVKQAVLKVGGTLLGVVLNNVDIKHDPESQYYTSYYEYFGQTKGKKLKTSARRETARPISVGGDEY